MHPTHQSCAIAATSPRDTLDDHACALRSVIYDVNYRSRRRASDNTALKYVLPVKPHILHSLFHQLVIAMPIGSELNKEGYLSHLYVSSNNQDVQDM